jgi:hypothetical protein
LRRGGAHADTLANADGRKFACYTRDVVVTSLQVKTTRLARGCFTGSRNAAEKEKNDCADHEDSTPENPRHGTHARAALSWYGGETERGVEQMRLGAEQMRLGDWVPVQKVVGPISPRPKVMGPRAPRILVLLVLIQNGSLLIGKSGAIELERSGFQELTHKCVKHQKRAACGRAR